MIFIDAFGEKAFRYAEGKPFISGITTNPSILKKTGVSFEEAVKILSDLKGTHFVQVSLRYRKWIDVLKKVSTSKFVIKVPWDITDSSEVAYTLKEMGFKVCATAVYNINQYITSVWMEVDYVAVYYDRMRRNNINPQKVIENFLTIRKGANRPRIIAASLKSVQDVNYVILAGVDDVTLPLGLLEEYTTANLPENDVEVFENDFR